MKQHLLHVSRQPFEHEFAGSRQQSLLVDMLRGNVSIQGYGVPRFSIFPSGEIATDNASFAHIPAKGRIRLAIEYQDWCSHVESHIPGLRFEASS